MQVDIMANRAIGVTRCRQQGALLLLLDQSWAVLRRLGALLLLLLDQSWAVLRRQGALLLLLDQSWTVLRPQGALLLLDQSWAEQETKLSCTLEAF